MKTSAKMTGKDRRAGIIKAARKLFVDKGFYRTTTRELAEAAGVSEALLFKHFPNKEALYAAIQMSCFNEQGQEIAERLHALEPSTSALVFLVRDLAAHLLTGRPNERERSFLHLVLRSMMDEGEFARVAIRGGPSHWVQKIEQCVEAARKAGDVRDEAVPVALGGWCVHHLVAGMAMHFLPAAPVIDYGIPHDALADQVTWFCLRGMGLKDEAIRRYWDSQGISGK